MILLHFKARKANSPDISIAFKARKANSPGVTIAL